MSTPIRRHAASGYSLIELLVVLAIVGILAFAGVTMIGNRQSGAVRGLLDEMEGALNNAQQAASATGRDVAIVTWGAWDTTTPDTGRLTLALGNAVQTPGQIQTAAIDLLNGAPHMDVLGQTVAVPFRFLPNDAIQSRARIVAIASPQWVNVMLPTASGTKNDDITTVEPFSSTMKGMVDNDLNSLFQGALGSNVISGSNKRFTTNFIIPVVGTTSSGGAVPGGPMGLIVVQQNGSSIFKFYNPGARDSDGHWRRL